MPDSLADRRQALSLIKQALDLWRVDPDEAPAAEQQAWADLLDVADRLSRIAGEPLITG